MADAVDCDVLVVGLGPVGAALTALLARRGLATIAIDKEITPYPMPRAVHFDHEIMRLFQQLGIAEQVAEGAVTVPRYEFRTADGQLLLSFDPVAEAASGWASGYMFHQPSLEAALRDLLAASPKAEVRLGWRLDGLTQTTESVLAQVTGPAGASTIRARYLVGCDGAWSPVREAMGAGLSDYGFDEPWLVVDAKVGPGARVPELNLQICDPARPTTCVRSGPGRHRWEFMLLPDETAEQAMQDSFIQGLLAAWDCGALEIERRAVYRFHGLVADRWRAGRLLLAGDSAHQMPPFAGQGMCSGLRDAVNLAWKLEAVIAGRGDDALLDSYQAEREPHVRGLIQLAIGMGQLVCTLDKAAAAARDQQMLAQRAAGAPGLAAPRSAPFAIGCIQVGSPGAGELFPQPTVGDGAARLRLDDALGDGAWLIARQPVTVSGGELVLNDLPGSDLRVRHLGDRALAGFRDALTTWLDARGAEAVLVRPDRYVFGSGAPDALATAWTRALHASRQIA